MLKFKKEEIEMEVSLKKRIEFICDFAKVKPKFINGNVINIEHTNLNYVEPHRVIIKNKIFLVFNYSNEIYIDNLNNKIKLTELEYFQEKFFTSNKYDSLIKELYLNDIFDKNDIEVIENNKSIEKSDDFER